jgi:hypothetical protein
MRRIWIAAVLPILSLIAVAQRPAPPPALELASIVARSCGISELDGRTVATGPGYVAHLGADALRFEAGAAALELKLLCVERGGELMLGAAAPQRPLARGEFAAARTPWPGVSERYDARPEGLEHSFVFDRPVGASGDLVVRFAANFSSGALAQISIGAVTGIDANGARAAGSVTIGADAVEYRLPASFVDAASWPLVLDPLLGGSILVDGSLIARDFDVAYSGTSDNYLVAWMLRQGSVDLALSGSYAVGNIVAQRISSSGALIGAQIALDLTARARLPKVGWCRNPNRFLVVWARYDLAPQADMYASGILAASGAASSAGALLFTLDSSELPVALTSETTTADDELLVIHGPHSSFLNPKPARYLRQVNVPASGVPVVAGSTVTLAATGDEFQISKQGGDAGRFLVVWDDSGAIYGRVFNRNVTALTPALLLADGTQTDLAAFADGNGTHFVVGWTRMDTATSDLGARIESFRYVDPGGGATLQVITPAQNIADSTTLDERVTGVAFTSEGALVSWRAIDASTETGTGYLRHIDNLSLGSIGADVVLHAPLYSETAVPIATQFQGIAPSELVDSNTRDEALAVWCAGSEGFLFEPTKLELRAQRFGCPGRVVDLGGECGKGGAAFAPGATPGNSGFELRLDGASPAVSAFALFGGGWSGFGCGVCALRVDPSTLIVLPRTTDTNGATYVLQAIPNTSALVGASFAAQWATLPLTTSAQCSTFGCDFSNGLSITIE